MTQTAQRLATRYPAEIQIDPGDVLNIQTGLQFSDLEPAKPNIVQPLSNCPFLNIIAKNDNGSFDIHNPTDNTVTFGYIAHHIHSVEYEPIPVVAPVVTPSLLPAPPLCSLPRDGGSESGFWVEGEDQSLNTIAWISPKHPGAIDDNDFNTPFLTIQGFLDAVGEPVDLADERRRFIALVAEGNYDQDLSWPAARQIHLLAMGSCVLGDGSGQYYSSTTPRNILYNYDGTKEFAGDPRPCLALGVLAPRVDAAGTHVAYASGWIISGSIIGTPGADPFTTIEMYLEGVEVDRGLLFTAPSGNINTYLRRCRFKDDGLTGFCVNGSLLRFQVTEQSRFDAAISIGRINRSTQDLYQGNITVSAIGTDVPPSGIFNADFGNGITFTGPANSFVGNPTTVYNALLRSIIFAGGALLTNAKRPSFSYVPLTPANWLPVPTNIWDALDQLANKAYGEMYNDQNAIATVINSATVWEEVFAGIIAGYLKNTLFVVPAGLARLQVVEGGYYKVSYSASLEPALDGGKIETGLAINGATPDRKTVSYNDFPLTPIAPVARYQEISGQAILLLAPGDQIRFMVRDNLQVSDITVRQLNVIIKKI